MSELTKITISNVSLEVFVRIDEEKTSPLIKEALELVKTLQQELGPNVLLEQLGVMLAGKIETINMLGGKVEEYKGLDPYGVASSAPAVVADGNHRLQFPPYTGKSIAECDIDGLKYVVQMSYANIPPADREAIMRYVAAVQVNPIGIVQVSFEDDDIPF